MHDHSTARIVTIYCLCDDFLRAWGHRDDPQAGMSTAEVMTVALVAAALFGGNHERSRLFLRRHGYSSPGVQAGPHTTTPTLWYTDVANPASAHHHAPPPTATTQHKK